MLFRLEILQNLGNNLMIIKNMRHFFVFQMTEKVNTYSE